MKFKKGDTIQVENFDCSVYLRIKSGIVKEYIDSKLLRVLKESDFITLPYLKGNHEFPIGINVTTAICAQDCELEKISSFSTSVYFKQRDELLKFILIARKSLLARICEYLKLYEGIYLTREELSQIANCAKETLIRQLRELEDLGVISRGKLPKILNHEELEKILLRDIDYRI